MIKLITESFDDDHIKNTRRHMSDREAERYIKKILRDNSIDLHDYHGNVGGVGWICIETYERGLPDGWQFTDNLTGINAYIDLDGNILRRYNDLETVYSDKYYRSQGGTRNIPESNRSWYVNNGYGGYADDDFDESLNSRRRYRKLVKEDIANEEKDKIIDEKGLRHYLFGDNYYSWDGWNFNKIIDALSEMEKKHKEFYRSGKKKNKVSKRNLHRYSMYVDALIQDADREAGNPVKAIDYSEIFDEFPELEQDAKRIGLKTK